MVLNFSETILCSTLLCSFLLSRITHAQDNFIPYGFQSDSTHSYEYRNQNSNGRSPADPSSFAGSVHYDPLHHALYMTGATFASQVFDGVDVFEVTTEKEQQQNDWWDVGNTGLNPHEGDLGVPGWSPIMGDCFYAVLGLPGGKKDVVNTDPKANKVKLVHSRRFGSEGIQEACSAIDLLFTSVTSDDLNNKLPGGYYHEFEAHSQDRENQLGSDQPQNTMPPDAVQSQSSQSDGSPTVSPRANPIATRTTGDGAYPTPSPVADGFEGAQGTPTISKEDMAVSEGVQGTPTTVRDQEDAMSWLMSGGNRKLRGERVKRETRRDLQSPITNMIATRSVRLLMAGHVESSNYKDGYIIGEMPEGRYNQASVYSFAQQVDIRLPSGDLELNDAIQNVEEYQAGNHENMDYSLHVYGTEEGALAKELEADWKENPPQEQFEGVVTSGVESRALLNDMVSPELGTVYPVSIVADPTTKKHYYVAMIASENVEPNEKMYTTGEDEDEDESFSAKVNDDPTIGEGASLRSFTGYDHWDDFLYINDEEDKFGLHGRPNYGSRYRVLVKRMSIESVEDAAELDDTEKLLAGRSHQNGTIAMRQEWLEEFEPDGNEDVRPAGLLFAPSGKGVDGEDVLIMVGTTTGRGSAFGTTESNPNESQNAGNQDLDGFITKIRTDSGAFSGGEKLDLVSATFLNTHSERIESNPGQDEIVAGVCSKPLRTVGNQDKLDHVYVVGSTSAKLPAMLSRLRNGEFEKSYPKSKDVKNFEAFLMKIALDTMNVVWTVQVGAYNRDARGNAFGYGCAVTSDGEDVYLSGLVKHGDIVTDFSDQDQGGVSYSSSGGTDIFISSYKTSDATRTFMKQVGSSRDDFPSRGNGGITTDRFGNAILTGNTRGSLMRNRGGDEFRYGDDNTAASDVFVLSFKRGTANHVPIGGDHYVTPPPPVPPVIKPITTVNPPTASHPTVSEPMLSPAPGPTSNSASASSSSEGVEKQNGALGSVIGLSLLFIAIVAVASGFVIYRMGEHKNKENEVLVQNSNLHSRRGSKNLQSKRRSTWGFSRGSSGLKGVNELNIMVEVRNSASGGWHGIYDDEQLQAIDFGVPTGNTTDDVVEQSLFMEDDGLHEIEESLTHYEIGEMEDVSDEDLIRAYEDAMALDIEPENPDVEFAMAGLGSDSTGLEDHHKIT